MGEQFIGDRSYPSDAARKRAVRALLARYEVNQVVDQEDDDLLLRDLLDRHPKAAEKIGPGVDHFRVVRTPRGPHKGPEVVRSDGTRIDFSYQKCLDSPSHRRRVLDSMRTEVVPQRDAYYEARKMSGTLVSDLTDTPLTPKETHVAYFRGTRFDDIGTAFAETAGGWEAFELSATTVSGLATFADRDLAARWHAYHREHATLALRGGVGEPAPLTRLTPARASRPAGHRGPGSRAHLTREPGPRPTTVARPSALKSCMKCTVLS
ncbi:DCL family protein [Streptomyces sp. CB03911]|uniref:DCL family protein n=1 Tax=Streptomyces sp. CB03911 TaxID=1804758 RepID=UPI00093A9E64|nr:DCL family protein [Streptomyces sp. CB03911]